MIPLVNSLDLLVKYGLPDANCDAEAYYNCLSVDIDNDTCQFIHDCKNKATQDDLMTANNNIMANGAEIQDAIDELSNEIGNEFMQAAQSQMDNVDKVGKSYASQNAKVLKEWGCDATCVDGCAVDWTSME